MHVIATAGHVDHGKSTLVRALTGTDPDRLAEERRRGLTIELGYAWTTLPGQSEPGAFVDVPGHERFVPTMLSGVGPVPAVLFVVAADDPWMPQAEEHLRALDAWGVRHGIVAVTRSDLADPGPTIDEVRARLAGSSLAHVPICAVSAATGAGLDALRRELATLTAALPTPEPGSDVRLWVDRCFVLAGAGTVVTGTLTAGTIRVGDQLHTDAHRVRVRSVQSLGHDVESVSGVARVALLLGGQSGRTTIARGTPLVTPDAWLPTTVADVRLRAVDGAPGHEGQASAPPQPVPQQPVLHIGAASAGCRVRPLDACHLRLTIDRPLPLRIGDRALLRDPGSRQVWGVQVLDPAPPQLRRRGAGGLRAKALSAADGSLEEELARRGPTRHDLLRRIGVRMGAGDPELGSGLGSGLDSGSHSRNSDDAVRAGEWWIGAGDLQRWRAEVAEVVAQHRRREPLQPGPTVGEVAHALRLPDVELVTAVVQPPLLIRSGRVQPPAVPLPPALERALATLAAQLTESPFAAPDAARLDALSLDRRSLAAAERAGRLLRLSDAVVLLPGSDRIAVDRLSGLPQPFTASQARQALGTSRRVALPLLDLLDRRGLTRRLPDDRRLVVAPDS
jgi:selenocysteine-specific elongation factor